MNQPPDYQENDEEKEYENIRVKNISTLVVSFKTRSLIALNAHEEDFFGKLNAITTSVEKEFRNFDKRYRVGGATNLVIDDVKYPFPVLSSHDSKYQLFPSLRDNNKKVEYHKLKFIQVEVKK